MLQQVFVLGGQLERVVRGPVDPPELGLLCAGELLVALRVVAPQDHRQAEHPGPLGRRQGVERPPEGAGRFPRPIQPPQSEAQKEGSPRVVRGRPYEPASDLVELLVPGAVVQHAEQARRAAVVGRPGGHPGPEMLLRLPQIQLARILDGGAPLAQELARVRRIAKRLVGIEPQHVPGQEPPVPHCLVAPAVDPPQLGRHLGHDRRIPALPCRLERPIEHALGIEPHEALLQAKLA